MSFIDQRLPQQVEIGAVRRERAMHEIVTTDGGHEVRNARHAQDVFEYDISFPTGEFSGTIIAEVKAMVKASRIGLYAFRFRDWDTENNTLTDEQVGTGDGSETEFQIKKTWTVGGISAERIITRPVSPLTVKLNGVTQGGGYSINYATGLLTFTSAPAAAAVIAVSGFYDIPVRFDLSYEATGVTGWLEHIDRLTLIEVKE